MWRQELPLSTLIGKTLIAATRVKDDEGRDDSDAIVFTTTEGNTYKMYHSQECCEHVTIDDICGDLDFLAGSPILKAEESTSDGVNPPGVTPPEYQDSFTWTFYHLATIKGYVTIRWYGESNGYYSESVTFAKIEDQ